MNKLCLDGGIEIDLIAINWKLFLCWSVKSPGYRPGEFGPGIQYTNTERVIYWGSIIDKCSTKDTTEEISSLIRRIIFLHLFETFCSDFCFSPRATDAFEQVNIAMARCEGEWPVELLFGKLKLIPHELLFAMWESLQWLFVIFTFRSIVRWQRRCVPKTLSVGLIFIWYKQKFIGYAVLVRKHHIALHCNSIVDSCENENQNLVEQCVLHCSGQWQ